MAWSYTWFVNKVMRLIQFNSVFLNYKSSLSPSKQFPWEDTHLRRRCSHSSQQCWRSLTGIAFSWSVTAFSMFSTFPKWCPLRRNFSFGNKKKSHGPRSGEYGGLWNNRNALFSQKFDHRDRRVTRGVVVMEHPIVSNAWSHANNSFSQSFKNVTVIKLINSLSLRHKFCMDNPLTVKKADEHGFYF